MPAFRALRVLSAERGGSSWPVSIDTAAGVFHTKLRGAAQAPASLVAEIVVGALAGALGLSVPARVLIDIPPDVRTFHPADVPRVDESLASKIVWLDGLVQNPDRTMKNPNLMWSHGTLWLIDHGASLGFQHDWSRVTEQSPRSEGWQVDGHVLRPRATQLQAVDAALCCMALVDSESLLVGEMTKLAAFLKPQRLLATACLLLTVACQKTQPADVAILGATVVNVIDGSLRADQTILIDGNRIVAIGPVAEVDVRAAAIVQAQGGYLIPGLWDMHVHSVANVAVDKSNRSTAAQNWYFPLFLAHGVTGVRNMNDGTADVTLGLSKSIRRRVAEGVLRGPPRFLTAGPSLDGDPPLGSNPVVVRTAAEARTAVEQLASNGADFIKVYENLSREAYFAIVDEARRRGIPVDGHVPFRVAPEEVAAARQRTAEHPDSLASGCSTAAEAERKRFAAVLDDYDNLPGSEQFLTMFRHARALYDSRSPAACAPAIEAYRRHGVAVTADLLAYHHVVHSDEVLSDTTSMRLVPEAIRRNWEDWSASEGAREFRSILRPIVPLELENVRLLNEGGVVLLAATDVGVPLQIPGLSMHRELMRLVEAGLTPLESLQTATINPARVLGMADSLGTVEPGRFADLILLDANPLEDISNTQRIRAVVADGRLYRRADLERLLAEAGAVH